VFNVGDQKVDEQFTESFQFYVGGELH